MKNYNYLKKKTENVLLKRYAFNYLFSKTNKWILIIFSLLNYFLFSLFYANKLCGFGKFWDCSLNWIALPLIIVLSGCVFMKISKYIPKFIWIGILGWILLTAEIIPGMMDYNFSNSIQTNIAKPNEQQSNNQKSIGMDVSRFLGNKVKFIEINSETKVAEFITKSFEGIFKPKGFNSLYVISNIIFFLSLISLFYFTFSVDKVFFNIDREIGSIISLIIIVIATLCLFALTNNYFIPLSFGLFGINISVVYWEITDRGRNPHPFLRAINFILVTQLITANIGEIIYISIYPLFNNAGYFNTRDFITFLWIIIAGSGLSVLMALISQIIWSGKRLTEKTN